MNICYVCHLPLDLTHNNPPLRNLLLIPSRINYYRVIGGYFILYILCRYCRAGVLNLIQVTDLLRTLKTAADSVRLIVVFHIKELLYVRKTCCTLK